MSTKPHDAASDDQSPILKVRLGKDGRPIGAAATARIDQPVARVWSVISDMSYAHFLPMVHRVQRSGDSVTFDLKFKVGFLSAGFQFTALATYEAERWLELRWTAGEPRDIRLRFHLTPIAEGRACLVEGDGEFDIYSLGWLVKFFLKNHPEIQFGVFPGVALVLIDSLRRAVAAKSG